MRLLLNFLTAAKTLLSLRAAVVLTPVLALVEKYLFNDWDFLASLCVLIMVDTVFGVQRGWAGHRISSRSFSRLFLKAGLYLGLLVLSHQLTTFRIHGVPNQVFTWFDKFMYSCMMAREAVSILEHVALLEPRLVPKSLLKRLALIADEGIEATLTAAPPATPATIQPEEGIIP